MSASSEVLYGINRERITHGLLPMRCNPNLERAAQQWVAICRARGEWAAKFADMDPRRCLEATRTDYVSAWLYVSTTLPCVEDSIAHWLDDERGREVMLTHPEIGLALHRELSVEPSSERWRWSIFTSELAPLRRVWW